MTLHPLLQHLTSSKYDFYVCLYQQEEEICSRQEGTFANGIEHLRSKHNVQLRKGRDYCSMCEVIFNNKLNAMAHYLSHVIEYGEPSRAEKTILVMGSGHHFWARAQVGMGFVGTGRHGQCHFINFWAWAPTIGHRALKGHE